MNRREFLQRSFTACSTIWFGQNFLSVCNAMADGQSTKLINIRSGFENSTSTNQNYFWLELAISSECEIIQSQTPYEFVFLIKKCLSGGLTRQMDYNNPYIKLVEVGDINQQDCSIRVIFKNPNAVSEMRYALIPSILHAGWFRLRIDVGNFSGSTAIKEKSLEIRETNLAFGSLDTRASTNLIVIHHIGLADVDVSAAEIHRWHLKNGWSGIGYHYVIHKNGMIERGRPRDMVGAHTYHYNQSSIGIVLNGNFEDAMPTDAQIQKVSLLVAALGHIYKICPDDKKLLGHRDLNSTLCPGKNLYIQLPQMRDKALAYFQQ